MKKREFRRAFLATVPVMTGYLFLGIGFGFLMQQKGYGVLWSGAMSLFIYAGSMQYVAVDLLRGGVGLLTVALTTLMVNARHLFYGISMVDAYRNAGGKKPYLMFALTDETYSLVAGKEEPLSYCLTVSVLNHCYWVSGTVLGALAGSLIRVELRGIEFVLTALFVTIFTEQWLTAKNHRPAILGLAITAVCLLIFGKDVFLIPSMALIALALLMERGKHHG